MAMASICTSSRTTSKGSIRQRRCWVRKTWPEPVLDLCSGESKGLSRISWFRIWRMAAMVAEACQTWTLPLHSWTLGGKSVQPTASQRLACQFWHSQVGIRWGNSSSKGKKHFGTWVRGHLRDQRISTSFRRFNHCIEIWGMDALFTWSH